MASIQIECESLASVLAEDLCRVVGYTGIVIDHQDPNRVEVVRVCDSIRSLMQPEKKKMATPSQIRAESTGRTGWTAGALSIGSGFG
jgi:hypothetical protein